MIPPVFKALLNWGVRATNTCTPSHSPVCIMIQALSITPLGSVCEGRTCEIESINMECQCLDRIAYTRRMGFAQHHCRISEGKRLHVTSKVN